jgi:hypothetical protein
MLDMLLGKIEKALRKSTGVLVDMGFDKAENMEKRILQTGGIRKARLL